MDLLLPGWLIKVLLFDIREVIHYFEEGIRFGVVQNALHEESMIPWCAVKRHFLKLLDSIPDLGTLKLGTTSVVKLLWLLDVMLSIVLNHERRTACPVRGVLNGLVLLHVLLHLVFLVLVELSLRFAMLLFTNRFLLSMALSFVGLLLYSVF